GASGRETVVAAGPGSAWRSSPGLPSTGTPATSERPNSRPRRPDGRRPGGSGPTPTAEPRGDGTSPGAQAFPQVAWGIRTRTSSNLFILYAGLNNPCALSSLRIKRNKENLKIRKKKRKDRKTAIRTMTSDIVSLRSTTGGAPASPPAPRRFAPLRSAPHAP